MPDSQSLGKDSPLSPGDCKTLPLIGRTCGSSPISTQKTPVGKEYKAFPYPVPSIFTMPSILNTPANDIPIHFFRLPIAQREILLVNVLTDPILYNRIITSALYHNNPMFLQAITLFHNYVLIRQMFARLAVPHLPVQIAEAFDPTMSTARTTILVLLVDRGLNRLLATLPRDHLTNILCTVLLSLSEEQCGAYYGSEQMEEELLQRPENGVCPPDPCSPQPARASSPTNSLSSMDTAVNPIPQLAR